MTIEENKTKPEEDKAKRDAAFAKHRREQQERWDLVPFWEKLGWLEEMHHIALHLQKSRASQRERQKGQNKNHE